MQSAIPPPPPSASPATNFLAVPPNPCSNAQNKKNEIRPGGRKAPMGPVPRGKLDMQNPTYENISIIGDGAMATVLAVLLCEKGIPVRIWGYDAEQLAEIAEARENKKFFPGYEIPESIIFEADDACAMAGSDLIVSAVPCQFMRSVWTRLAAWVPDGAAIVSVAKGIENDTLMRPTQILAEVLGLEGRLGEESSRTKLAVLSGPTIADELARNLPATACVAAEDSSIAERIQHTFSDGVPWLRVYTNPDVLGVELAGAMKNVIAIAAGLVDGTALGDNAKAALLTRGLAEITRLGVAMGAEPQTFTGLAGLGDLVTTCISPSGRNRSFGERIGMGQTVHEAREATKSVVEGITTCESVVALAERHKVEMPITRAIYEILFKNKPLKQAVADLMHRKLKAE